MKRLLVLLLLAAGCAAPPPEAPVASAPVEVQPTAAAPAADSAAPAESPRGAEIPRTVAVRDPFTSPLPIGQPPPQEAPPEDRPRTLHRPEPRPPRPAAMPDLELTGILLSPAGNRALVRQEGGTHVVGVGDRVDGFRVTSIEAARITLSDGTRSLHLQLPAARES